VLFRLGRVRGVREPGLNFIIPVIDVLRKVSYRIVTMPIQSQDDAAQRGRAAQPGPDPLGDAEGESAAAAALGDASDTMMLHPLALQLRNLQSLIEIGVDKNTTVVFPAPLMSTIGDLGAFLRREATAAGSPSHATPTPVSEVGHDVLGDKPHVVEV